MKTYKALYALMALFLAMMVFFTACEKDNKEPDSPDSSQTETPGSGTNSNPDDGSDPGTDPDPGSGTNPDPEGVENGHDYVNLGLPSGLKWATCNVGASSPTESGDYFAWGETSPKSNYTAANCLTYDKEDGKEIGPISGNPEYDAARVNWGGTWRLPSMSEFTELIDNCSWNLTTVSEINGYEVTGPNGSKIFLPAAGHYSGTYLYYLGREGRYWSSGSSGPKAARILDFYVNNPYSHNPFEYAVARGEGLTVRAVTE